MTARPAIYFKIISKLGVYPLRGHIPKPSSTQNWGMMIISLPQMTLEAGSDLFYNIAAEITSFCNFLKVLIKNGL